MHYLVRVFAVAVSLLVGWPEGRVFAQLMDTSAKNAYIVDMSTGRVLLEKAADEPIEPASLSKLMTTYMAFEAIRNGTLDMDRKLLVSKRAWKKGGSRMFVEVDERVRVSDLLRGIIVQSGNDSCIVIAEAMAGTEDRFAQQMTRRARDLGLENSTFRNSSGWPHPEHRMSARDLAKLSARLISDFPELYKIFAERTFTYNGIRQFNRNPLLKYENLGADGLKTGYTRRSGYGLVGAAQIEGRRIIAVLTGFTSERKREHEAVRLMEWAFSRFELYTLFKPGEDVVSANVWLGENDTVPLTIPDGLKLTLSNEQRAGLSMRVRLVEPVSVPIKKGVPHGTLIVSAPGMDTMTIPLVTGKEVKKLGFFARITAAIKHVLWGAT